MYISLCKLKNFFFFVFLLLFFLTFNENIPFLSILKSTDEIFLAISLICILFTMINQATTYKIDKTSSALLLYMICQFINYIISPFDLKIIYVVVQSLINIKLFIVALAVLLVFEPSKYNFKIIRNLHYLFISIFIFGMVANLIMQENWNTMMNSYSSYRYGFIRPAGWLGNSAQNGYFFSLTLITMLLLNSKEKEVRTYTLVKKFFLFIIIDFIMAYPLTVRKGLMSNIAFGFVIFGKISRRKKIIFSIMLLIFFPIFLYAIKDLEIATDTISNLQDSTTNDSDNSYIRGLMIYNGYSLFSEFFPFGVGAATFGTTLSTYNTLAVYNHVHFNIAELTLSDGSVNGIYDSGFFSMLAENGFIGMMTTMSFIYYFFKFNKTRLDSYNYMIFKTITWFAILLSLTDPVWQNGMFTVIYIINILYIYKKWYLS